MHRAQNIIHLKNMNTARAVCPLSCTNLSLPQSPVQKINSAVPQTKTEKSAASWASSIGCAVHWSVMIWNSTKPQSSCCKIAENKGPPWCASRSNPCSQVRERN
jgi:hypothetical protein